MQFFLLSLIASASLASANPLFEKRQCNADNCARAVTGTNVKNPPLATRRAQCEAFMMAQGGSLTIQPTGGRTVTVTVTPTVTYFPPGATSSASSSQASVGIMTMPDLNGTSPHMIVPLALMHPHRDVEKARSKKAARRSSASSASSKATSKVTSIAVGTTSVKATVSAATDLVPVTTSAVSSYGVDAQGVPLFATACSGAVRYSSACSCWGYTAGAAATGAPAANSTVTVTVAKPVTETVGDSPAVTIDQTPAIVMPTTTA